MTEHPIVLSQTTEAPDTSVWQLRVPSDCKFFDGHFDGNPILPGVTQVHWVMAFTNDMTVTEFVGLPQVKFMQPILPNAELSLRICHQGNKLQFEYFDDTSTYSAGTVTVS